MIKKKKVTDVSVVFENIHLERATNVSEKGKCINEPLNVEVDT